MGKGFKASKESQKICKQCRRLIILKIDPHNRCKTCRQPDIEQYYCSDSDCEDCKQIKSRPPLYYVLQKREMGKISKRINFDSPECNLNLSSSSRTRGRPRSKKYIENTNDDNSNSHSFSNSKHGHKKNKTPLTRERLPENMAIENRPSQEPGSSTSDSFPKDLQNFLSQFISLLPNSDAKDALSNSEITKKISKNTNEHVIPQTNCEASSSCQKLYSPEHSIMTFLNAENFAGSIISLFKIVNPSALAPSNLCSITGKSDICFKISPSACNILYKSTILFSPSHAEDLKKMLKLEEDCLYWPSDLNANILLNIDTRQLPTIKLLPKIRTLQRMLYGKLNATLPKDILADDLILPPLSLKLNNDFMFVREQLQRLLLIMSMIDQFLGEHLQNNILIQNLFKLLMHLLEETLKEQANYLGLVIQSIRRELLHEVVGHDPSVVPKLIMGPVDDFYFFGPYVKELLSHVKDKGPSYCLRPSKKPSMKLIQLPKPFKVGDNIKLFSKDLLAYYNSSRNTENDHETILVNLLPKEIFERLVYLIKPCKISDKKLEEIVIYLENVCKSKTNSISSRFAFNRTSQEEKQTIQEYAKELETKVILCDYAIMERELLRDQFIFGLKNKDLSQDLMEKLNFSYEECVEYAINIETKLSEKKMCSSSNGKSIVVPKNPMTLKRKMETLPEKVLVKKVKLKAVSSFYGKYAALYDSPKKEIVNVCNAEDWNKLFGCKAIYSYTTNCPWSGKILRA